MAEEGSRYDALIESVFFDHYREGESEFEFARTELESAAKSLGIDLPKNLGDVIYSYRFRKDLPAPVAATPELIRAYKLDDEQALLAILRYNRLIDTFPGLTTYSLQNHLRTAVHGVGQIEIDELYVGIDKRGRHYVIPVQAKGGNDRIGTVQAAQDIRFVQERFAGMRCRAIAAQFMDEEIVALFELTEQRGEIRVVEERHYRLVPAKQLDREAIRDYS